MGIKERFAKLVDVKSITTIVCVIIFAILSLTEKISGQEFMSVFIMIMGFYFGTQSAKKAEG